MPIWAHRTASNIEFEAAAAFVAIFAKPARASGVLANLEAPIKAFGPSVTEGAGSRLKIELSGIQRHFHPPRPDEEGAHEQHKRRTNSWTMQKWYYVYRAPRDMRSRPRLCVIRNWDSGLLRLSVTGFTGF